ELRSEYPYNSGGALGFRDGRSGRLLPRDAGRRERGRLLPDVSGVGFEHCARVTTAAPTVIDASPGDPGAAAGNVATEALRHLVQSGGGGNRTPVRRCIHEHIYVCSL